MMAWHWYAHDGGLSSWIWLAWMLVFWVALAVAVVYFIRRGRAAADVGPSAEQVLAERYARGEIDAEEYRQRQAVLREQQTRTSAPHP